MSEPKKVTLQIDGEEMVVCMPEKIMSDGGPSNWKYLYYRPDVKPEKSFEEELKEEYEKTCGYSPVEWEGMIGLRALATVLDRRLAALKKELGGR